MPNLKQVSLLLLSSLAATLAGAHINKGYDRNGGHSPC